MKQPLGLFKKIIVMKKKRKIKKKILYLFVIFISFIVLLLGTSYYFYSSVSNDKTKINVVIPSGYGLNDIAKLLKEKELIKSEKFFVMYLKLKRVDNIYAASYIFDKSMNLNDIAKVLELGGENSNLVSITFEEGINMRKVATLIDENTVNSYDDVINLLKDKDYLNSLIDKYWFIPDDIKNNKIYYSLEGYLYPDTYFVNKDDSVKDIFSMMLDKMDSVLSKYKDKINKNNIHKILTLSSVTQSEGVNKDDFKNIASVFLNRIEIDMPLGSCVTSYYGVKKDMNSELLQKDIDAKNAYNTRGESPVLIPVGPISLPSSDAIDAVINPIKTDYYYFVSDINNKLYFTKSYSEHVNMQKKLQNEGLWLEW